MITGFSERHTPWRHILNRHGIGIVHDSFDQLILLEVFQPFGEHLRVYVGNAGLDFRKTSVAVHNGCQNQQFPFAADHLQRIPVLQEN